MTSNSRYVTLMLTLVIGLSMIPFVSQVPASDSITDPSMSPDIHQDKTLYNQILRDSYNSTLTAISIDGDAALATFASQSASNVNGTGTSGDPYVIYGYNLTSIAISNLVSSHVVITGNMIKDTSTTGIEVSESLNVTISENIISYATNQGISITSVAAFTASVHHNWVEYTGSEGIYISGSNISNRNSKFVAVNDNAVFYTWQTGIYMAYLGHIITRSNFVAFVDSIGILAYSSPNFDIDSNEVYNTQYEGIVAHGIEADGNITGNIIKGVDTYGIRIGSCCGNAPSYINVTGNWVESTYNNIYNYPQGTIIHNNYLVSQPGNPNIYLYGGVTPPANITVTDNEMYGGGMGFGGGASFPDFDTFFFSFSGNSLNGGSITLVSGVNNVSYDGSIDDTEQFIVYNSSHVDISNYDFSNVDNAITIYQSDNVTISHISIVNLGHGFIITQSADLIFSDISMSHSHQIMFQIDTSTNVRIEDMTLLWSGSDAIISSFNYQISFDRVYTMSTAGVALDSYYDTHVAITDSWFGKSSDGGIHIEYSTNITVKNSVVRETYGSGVAIYDSDTILVQGNVITESYSTDLDTANNYNSVVMNNLIHGSYQPVYFYNMFNSTLVDNHIISHHPYTPVYISFGSTTGLDNFNVEVTGNTIVGRDGYDSPLIAVAFIGNSVVFDGNYYSNYGGSGSYQLEGHVTDDNPLTVPAFEFDNLQITGENITYAPGTTEHSITFGLSGLSFYMIYLDSVQIDEGFSPAGQISVDVDGLSEGIHTITLLSPGYYQHQLSYTISVNVADQTQATVTETEVSTSVVTSVQISTTTQVSTTVSNMTVVSSVAGDQTSTSEEGGFSSMTATIFLLGSIVTMVIARRKRKKSTT